MITSEISSTSSKTKNLQVEISELKSKTENLMKTVFKFTKGKENLDKLLSSQKVSFYKNGIGYSHFNKPSCMNQKTIVLSKVLLNLKRSIIILIP